MSGVPVIFLRAADGRQTTVRIERPFSVADTGGSDPSAFDAMLTTYLGGYRPSHIPRDTSFNLRGIPPGAYNLLLYGGQTDVSNGTDFYVRVNAGSTVVKSVTPSVETAFVENANYAVFSLAVISVDDVVHITAVGFLNGMQLVQV